MRTKCTYDPRPLLGLPMGFMFHCPECGEIVLVGMEHPDYSILKEEDLDYIPLDQCIDGHLYKIDARNGSYGVFNKKDSSFTLARTKFSDTYLFDEFHWDTGAPYGTVKPLEDLGQKSGGDLLTDLMELEKRE